MKKLFFLMTILALVLGGTFAVIGCGDDDDDDDTTDDDTDDDDADLTCEEAIALLYGCDLVYVDADGNPIAEDSAMLYCDADPIDSMVQCTLDCAAATPDDCAAMETCAGGC